MTVSQPREWNYLVTPPMSWRERWRVLKLILPIMFFVAICGFEITLLNLWLADAPKEKWSLLLLSPMGSVAYIVLAIEALGQFEARCKRVLRLRKRAVWLEPAPPGRVPWKHVRQWQFEPVPQQPDATKVTLFYAWSKKHVRKWPVLLQRSDREALFLELAERKSNGAAFDIAELEEPAPIEVQQRKSFSGLWLWLLMAGWLLVIHSVGPLVIGIPHKPEPAATARPPSKNMERFVEHHMHHLYHYFGSFKEFQQFSLRVGLALASSGLLLMVWANLRAGRSVEPASSNQNRGRYVNVAVAGN